MSMLWIWITLRILSNPCSNALQKALSTRGWSAPLLLALTHGAMALPAGIWLLRTASALTMAFWCWSLLSAVLAVTANWLIIEAVRRTDLSILGPINSYKPWVSLLPGMVFLGERLTGMQLMGMGLVLAGSLYLVSPDSGPRGIALLTRDRGVQLRALALLFSAAEAVALKRVLEVSSPGNAFAGWILLGFLTALPFAVKATLDQPVPERFLRSGAWGIVALTLTTGIMQFCTLVTLKQMPVGIALSLFQISTLLSVFLGKAVFQEPHFGRRLAGATIMACGASLLVFRS